MIPDDFSFIGQVGSTMLFYSASCSSTQDLVHRCAETVGKKQAVALMTFDQTRGRGQFNRPWMSKPGLNLAVSVLYPLWHWPADRLVLLNKAVTLAVVSALKEAGATDARIKWPNDIRSGGAKFCGILLEISGQGNQRFLCAGCGVNVNQTDFEGLDQEVTSLRLLTGKEFALRELGEALLWHMEAAIDRAERPGEEAGIEADYENHLEGRNALWLLAGEHGELEEGYFLGTDAAGRAIVRLSGGAGKHFHHGEIRLRKKI